jgi:hypothetical protein
MLLLLGKNGFHAPSTESRLQNIQSMGQKGHKAYIGQKEKQKRLCMPIYINNCNLLTAYGKM